MKRKIINAALIVAAAGSLVWFLAADNMQSLAAMIIFLVAVVCLVKYNGNIETY